MCVCVCVCVFLLVSAGASADWRDAGAILLLADWSYLRFSRRVSSSPIGIVFVSSRRVSSFCFVCCLHGACLPRRLKSSSFLTASLFLTGCSSLRFFTASLFLCLRRLSLRRGASSPIGIVLVSSWRVSSSEHGVVFVFHGESLRCRLSSSSLFTASLFFFIFIVSSRRVSSYIMVPAKRLFAFSLRNQFLRLRKGNRHWGIPRRLTVPMRSSRSWHALVGCDWTYPRECLGIHSWASVRAMFAEHSTPLHMTSYLSGPISIS